MATTLKADMFVPEVATAVATAEFANRLAVSFAGTPFVRPFPPEATLGDEGDTVKFPRYNVLTEMDSLTEDVAMTPEKLNTSQDTSIVQVFGKAVEITDFASLSGRGDPSAEVGRQMGILGARKVDAALVTEAETTSLSVTHAGTPTYEAFVDAVIDKWSDKALEDVAGLIVHSKQLQSLFKLEEFKSADYANVAQAVLANRTSGMPVGVLMGIPVWVSDRLTVNTTPTPDEYTALVLKRGGLGLRFQRSLLVELDRDILKKNDVIAADVRFAVHLFFGNPSPAIKWITQ